MFRQRDLKDQCLVIKIESAGIRIRDLATVDESILGDEIIVRQTEYKPFVVISI